MSDEHPADSVRAIEHGGACPACGTATEPLEQEQRVDIGGNRHPEWWYECPNPDCRVGPLEPETATEGPSDA